MHVKVGRRIALILLITLAISACSDDQQRKAAQASDTLAQSIAAAISVKRELVKEGHLKKDEELKITEGLLLVNDAATEFNNQVKSVKTWDANSKAVLAATLSRVTNSLKELTDTGVLKLSDPGAQQKLTAAIATIQQSITLLGGFLQ